MFGRLSTPLCTAAGVTPSLNPLNEVSNARTISSIYIPSKPRSRSLQVSPPGYDGMDSLSKLNDLIQIIDTVTKGYSVYPTKSPRLLTTLRQYHRRAMMLHPDVIHENDEWTTSTTFSRTSPVTPLSSVRDCAQMPNGGDSPPGGVMKRMLNDSEIDLGKNPHAVFRTGTKRDSINQSSTPLATNDQATSPSGDDPTIRIIEEQINQLVDEWRQSEVAAAWFGPRPCHTARPPAKAKTFKDEMQRALIMKRESSFVGLFEE